MNCTIERLKILVKNNDIRSPRNLLTNPFGPTKNTIPGWPSRNYHNPRPSESFKFGSKTVFSTFSFWNTCNMLPHNVLNQRSIHTTHRQIEICHLLTSHNKFSQNFAKALSSNFFWDNYTQEKCKNKQTKKKVCKIVLPKQGVLCIIVQMENLFCLWIFFL